jgi:hypothetical protein
MYSSRDSSVGIVLGYGLDDQGVESRQRPGIFLYTIASRPALGPTQPLTQWVPGSLSLGVKRPEREADHSSPSSAEVKVCVELYFHSPNTPSWHGAQLTFRHRNNFTFTFYVCIYVCTYVNEQGCVSDAPKTPTLFDSPREALKKNFGDVSFRN